MAADLDRQPGRINGLLQRSRGRRQQSMLRRVPPELLREVRASFSFDLLSVA